MDKKLQKKSQLKGSLLQKVTNKEKLSLLTTFFFFHAMKP